MSGQGGQRLYSHAERLRIVYGVTACVLLVAVDQTVVLPAIPQIAHGLGGRAHLSWVVSVYLLTSTATAPIYGKLSDQFGRARILLPALVGFLLASLVCAMAQSVPELIGARALQGLGGGALMAVAQAAMADVVPLRERGRYQAWIASAWALASGAGPVIGGIVVEHFSWRWIFWGNLPVGLLAFTLVARGMAGLPAAGARGSIDYLGAVLLLAAVSALLAALSAGGVDLPWLSLGEAALLGAASLGVVLLVTQQRRAESPLFPAVLVRNATFRVVLGLGFCISAGMFCIIFLLPLLLQTYYHLSPQESGLGMVPYLFATTVGAFSAGQIARHTGRVRPQLVGGLALAVVGFSLLAAGFGAGGVFAPIGLSALAALGLGAAMPSSLVAAQSQAARGDMGSATGLLLLVRAVGGAFGATLAELLRGIGHIRPEQGFHQGFVAASVCILGAFIAASRLPEITLQGAK